METTLNGSSHAVCPTCGCAVGHGCLRHPVCELPGCVAAEHAAIEAAKTSRSPLEVVAHGGITFIIDPENGGWIVHNKVDKGCSAEYFLAADPRASTNSGWWASPRVSSTRC